MTVSVLVVLNNKGVPVGAYKTGAVLALIQPAGGVMTSATDCFWDGCAIPCHWGGPACGVVSSLPLSASRWRVQHVQLTTSHVNSRRCVFSMC